MHLKACFPKFDELIAEFQSPAFYKNHFQVDEDGRKLGDAPEQEADQGADTDDEDNMSPKKGAEDEMAMPPPTNPVPLSKPSSRALPSTSMKRRFRPCPKQQAMGSWT